MARKKNGTNIKSDDAVVTPKVDEVIETPKADEEITESILWGKVTNCNKLNVRKQPNTDGVVIAVVDKNTAITIDLSKSTDEWYSVVIGNTSGYCMKKYVTI